MTNWFSSKTYKRFVLSLLMMLFFCINTTFAQFYNGSQMTFGKNRIQYTTDRFWSFYRFNDFDTYYYKGGQSLAIYASAYADKQLQIISDRLDFKPENKLKFLIFNDLSDLKETNIGLITNEDYNIGGATHVVDNKIFVYYQGSHYDFEKQIKEGIAKAILNEMIYDGKTLAKIKNSALTSFPDWYTDGLASYISEDWSTQMDDFIRQCIKNKTCKKFDRLNAEEQMYIGHSIWRYIEMKYGPKALSNMIFISKISRNIDAGFSFGLGVSYKDLISECTDFYTKLYSNDENNYQKPSGIPALKKSKKTLVYSQAKLSSDGRYLAYTTNENGKIKIFVLDTQKKNKKKKIMKYGYKLNEKVDYSYPLLAWSPKSNDLSIIFERKNINELLTYSIDSKEKRIKYLNQFDKVHDFSYNNKGNQLAISAIRNGQTNIYSYNIAANSSQQITSDAYDDVYPRFVNNDNAIIWSSNRINDTLKVVKQLVSEISEDTIRGQKNNDLFFYKLSDTTKIAKRITKTPLANEIYPMSVGYNKFSWLSDENGIYNRYNGQLDSNISFVDTTTHYRFYTKYSPASNYNANILEQDFNNNIEKYTEILNINGVNKIFIHQIDDFDNSDKINIVKTSYSEYLNNKRKLEKQISDSLTKQQKEFLKNDSLQNKTNSYAVKKDKTFRTISFEEFKNRNSSHFNNLTDSTQDNLTADGNKQKTIDEIKAAYVTRPYNVEYNVSQLVSQIDFNYLNYSYQPFTNPKSPIFISQGLNAFIKLGVMDLLEDYRLIGGVKVSPNLRNNEYFLTFSDYKNRIDKDYTFHRNVIEDNSSNESLTHYLHEIYVKAGIPFNNVQGLKITMAFRNDITVTKATDNRTLTTPNATSNNAILRLEYIFDNTISGGTNILYGTRLKIFSEYYQRMEFLNKNLITIGLDSRKYIKIHKTFVWANRFACSSSLGKQRLIYYLGGVDSWVNADFNRNIQVDESKEFVYQTLATNMRGFKQNIRNGNNFAVINSELRFPPFQYFSKKPLKSSFLNNFMIVSFFDVGTAWSGPNPFSESNSLFKRTIYQNPIQVTIINQDDPIVAGYGFGLHSQVLGYYMRADWAWGIENGYVHKKPSFYFSLSLDF